MTKWNIALMRNREQKKNPIIIEEEEKEIDSNNSNALNSDQNEGNEAMKKKAQTDDRIPFLLSRWSTLCLFRLMFRYLKIPANVIFIWLNEMIFNYWPFFFLLLSNNSNFSLLMEGSWHNIVNIKLIELLLALCHFSLFSSIISMITMNWFDCI